MGNLDEYSWIAQTEADYNEWSHASLFRSVRWIADTGRKIRNCNGFCKYVWFGNLRA